MFGIIVAISVLTGLTSCGGVPATANPAQGLFVGSAIINGIKNTFQAVVLPDGRFFALSASAAQGVGTLNGQGATVSGSYSVDNMTVLSSGALYLGSLQSTIQGAVLEGTVSIPSEQVTWTFTTAAPATTSYNYNTPAKLASVEGNWMAAAWTATSYYGNSIGKNGLQINQIGTLSSDSQGSATCSYNGSLSPDNAHSFYNVSVTYSGSCPTRQLGGVAVVTESSSQGVSKQLQVILSDGEGFVMNPVPAS